MNTLDVLHSATRPGWKTSEFWVALLGIAAAAVPAVLPAADKLVGDAGGKLAQHGTAGAIAAGAIAGAYAIGRSIVKAMTAKALLTPVEPPVIVTPAPADVTDVTGTGR